MPEKSFPRVFVLLCSFHVRRITIFCSAYLIEFNGRIYCSGMFISFKDALPNVYFAQAKKSHFSHIQFKD